MVDYRNNVENTNSKLDYIYNNRKKWICEIWEKTG